MGLLIYYRAKWLLPCHEGKGIFTAEEGVRYEISLITCFSSELSWTCGLLMFDAAPSF